MFKENVGTLDRMARVVIGLFLMWYGYDHQSWWGLLGIAVFMTGIFGRCGLYALMGFSTCPVKTSKAVESVPPVNPTA